ncbi:methionine adenosyltransferase [Candidatus Uhrbacteria bacterium CG_4_10_14_0_8_um_filter_58_22]|uniref:Methionine adenosyltransferase n=1 Tax=Candidatus Uhrbacteria bacterium CG_4_10_14_0_8_um_filter_58_22 TaxID=1975029 RepID=A0A2M7QAN4_9BACT|nr:MAG: methionine adenosyltransferase [Candidatus Uhrbacteria bacterium CG_4_10_14_0_8_um_filter_58_22]
MAMKTVESVTEGHPDKVCDQIADAVLDAYLAKDPLSRVAVEVFGSHGAVMIGGEVSSAAEVDPAQVAQAVYKEIGYEDDIEVFTNIEEQSPDIARGVDTGGAGDQGIMYGYATVETPEFLPRAVVLAHRLSWGLGNLRRHHSEFKWLRPDGKTQVTVDGTDVHTVVVSAQHAEGMDQEQIRSLLNEHLIMPTVGSIKDRRLLINPTGSFVSGGFSADTGLTGRKLMVDTYGGLIPHGGGAFSGKDSTKVDRSGAYMARFAAKNIVANGVAKNCLVTVAYAIGHEEPVMLEAKSGDGRDLSEYLKQHFDFRPMAIIERLGLRRPIFRPTAAYGHFGRDEFPWEHISLN